MTAAVKLPPLMTTGDFLDWPGDGRGTRYELVDGVLCAQDPANDTHGTIQTNLIAPLANHLKQARPRCRVVTNPGVQPRLRANWNFRNPDFGVTCAPNRAGAVMMPEPILLIEVLSPGNGNDTWDNIPHYASIPTIAEILIVHSTQVKAELLQRGSDRTWPENPDAIEAGGTISLASVGLELPMTDVYAQTHLAAT